MPPIDRNSVCFLDMFFFLLRVGEMEGIRWAGVPLSIDSDGDACLRLGMPRSKTDHYNEGHAEALKGDNRPLWPARGFARRLGTQSTVIPDGDAPVFSRNVRRALAHSSKIAASAVGLDFTRASNHYMCSGGASLMFAVGFDMDIIKRGSEGVCDLPPVFAAG